MSTIYTVNNERLAGYENFLQFKYDNIYAPASGSLSEYLWYKFGHKDTKLIIYDYHTPSLNWKKLLYDTAVEIEDISKITDYTAKTNPNLVLYSTNIDAYDAITKENLNNFSVQQWIDTIKKINNVEFIQIDVIKDMLQVDETEKNFIAFSNIFSYNLTLQKIPLEEINNSLLRYYKLKNTLIIGKRLDDHDQEEYRFVNINL